MMNELQHFLNSNHCVTIPNRRNEKCNYLVRDNFLSEYVTSEDKLKVLDSLGILRYLQNIQDNINKNLSYYVSLDYLEQNFVKKRDIYSFDGSEDYDIDNSGSNNESGSSNSSGNIITNIDDELSLISINPVQNKIITRALIEKVDLDTLEQYTKFVDLVSYLRPYQKELNAGEGIIIDKNTNTISVTLDINPFVVVNDYPQGNDINPNKIYIIKRDEYYVQYKYTPNGWIELGRDNSLNINMSDYYTKDEADNRYMLKTQYSDVEQFVQTYVTDVLVQYVKKSDVYYGNDENPSDEGGGSSSGESSINNKYNSLISDGITTNVTVGNISQGTDIASLRDLSFTELFDMILFKEIWPNINYEHNINLGILPTIVKVGDPVIQPSVQAIWNDNILPLSEITYNLVQSVQGNIYENAGTETFTLNYSYPDGTYTITSNYGNTREIEKQAKQGTIVRTVEVTYPWYLNDIEQSVLVPINTDHTLQVVLTGTPSIAIPGQYSSCQIQGDLGLGYMDITNWIRTTTEKNGITYSVWTKPDTYLQNVEHKITFNISL